MAIYNVMYGTRKIAFATVVVSYPYGSNEVTCTNSFGYSVLSSTSREFYLDFPAGSTQSCVVTVKFGGVTQTSEQTDIAQNSTRNVDLKHFTRYFFQSGVGQVTGFFSGRGNSAYSQGSIQYRNDYMTLTAGTNQSMYCCPQVMPEMTGWKYFRIRYSRSNVESASNYNLVMSQGYGDNFWPSKTYSYTMPYWDDTKLMSIDVSSLGGYRYWLGPYIYNTGYETISLNVYDLYLETF